MKEIKYIAIINNKKYEFNTALKILILENAVNLKVKEENYKKFIHTIYELYLKDIHDTKIEKLCEYCHKNWASIQNKSYWDILYNYYLTMGADL